MTIHRLTETFPELKEWHEIHVFKNRNNDPAVIKWCQDNCRDRFVIGQYCIVFKSEEDAFNFLLTWERHDNP